MNTDKEKLLVAECAAEWLRRLETAGPEERAEFWRWLTESPLHLREALIAKACHVLLAHLLRDRPADTAALMSRASNVSEIESHQAANDDRDTLPAAEGSSAEHSTVGPTAARRPTWRIAAVVSFMALGTFAAMAIKAVSDHSVVTGSGESRTVQLADGTLLHAGPRTIVLFRFTNDQRIVRLVRGEAMFHVAKDRRRPFLVNTDLATARAVGTAFAVSRVNPAGVVVTVEEGVVAVDRRSDAETGRPVMNGASESVTLRAGEQVRVEEAVPLAVRNVDVRKELAWVDGRLVFDRETVAEAAQAFELRNHVQIKILDPEVARRAVRGVFDAGDPEAFAAFLENVGLVSVVKDEHGTLLLVPPRRVDKEWKEQSAL